MLKTVSKFVVSIFLVTSVAWGQQGRVYGDSAGGWTQEITGSLGQVKILRVRVDMGTVKVAGGGQPGISYVIHTRSGASSEEKARREFDAYKITATVRGDTATIEGDWEGGRTRHFSGDFMITVPREIEEVKIETEGGNIETTGIQGKLNAESGGGNIHLDDIKGSINAETGGGGIDLGSAGSDVSLHTGGGSIHMNNVNGRIIAESGGGSITVNTGSQGADLQTGGGSIQLQRCNGLVKASTGGGSIDLGDVGGPAEIETGGGSIRLASAKGFVKAETGGGSIELGPVPGVKAETAAGGITVKMVPGQSQHQSSTLETSAGDIVVYLAPNINLSVRASIEVANGHNIHSDFSDIKVTSEGGDWGPKTISAEGNVNGGGPELKVTTMTGDISFRRANQ
jgi:DUF4097 and DUF4098 domain-containing protein YvlB